jgi:predicted Na+-dependent transporter
MRLLLDFSSFIPVPTLPRKLATILLLAFLLFKLVAALSQCLCLESNKKNGVVGEYPQ